MNCCKKKSVSGRLRLAENLTRNMVARRERGSKPYKNARREREEDILTNISRGAEYKYSLL